MSKQEQWFSLVAEQQQSSLTITAFCAFKGIKLCTFHYWRSRYLKAKASATGFISITPAAPTQNNNVIRLLYPNGVSLELPAADLSLITQLLRLA